MKKRIFSLIGILLLAVCLIQPAFSFGGIARFVDEADILTDSEEATLSAKLDEISLRQNLDVVIVTVNSTGERTVTEYADDIYDDRGYGTDGVLLLISMENHEWAVSTSGYGITAFTDAGIDHLTKQLADQMSAGEWNDAFHSFAGLCDKFITQAKTGEPYDMNNLSKKPFTPILTGAVSAGIGFVIAFFRMNRWKNQLYSVEAKAEAKEYVRGGSLKLTEQRDLFLYRRVDRQEKSDDSSGGSSTHTSSSGKTHGGASGSF